jgi:hypothetical protein
MRSKRYKAIFGTRIVDGSVVERTEISKGAKASHEFETTAEGIYLAVGLRSGFMGYGAQIEIIDDPFRSRKEADSKTIRENVWSSFDDLETRIEPNGILVVMHTRWHDDDLVGRIIKERIETGVEDWRILAMPLIANECLNWEKVESGQGTAADRESYDREEALWPDRHTLDDARHKRRTKPPRTWCSLYQQKPNTLKGDFIQGDWLQRFPATVTPQDGGVPSNVRRYLCADYGVKEGGDTTEIYAVAIDEHGHWWVYDCWAGRERADVWCDALVDMIVRENPDLVAGEAGVIRRAAEPFIEMMMNERQASTVFEWAVRSSDKEACAVPLQGIAHMRRLHIAFGSWGDRLVGQLVAFPTSEDDHGVDALANLGLLLEQAPGAFAQKRERAQDRKDRWAEAFAQARSRGKGRGSWKTM